ncbi:helix-turn-helix domain-containing protein [Huintestinicola sp.]|uniref:helix-turn-helix domain-containing protein n=1 Tax=Huintestinicola sp. TaxID=2981661 RepID=UPI003D7F0059
MNTDFPRIITLLRKERNISQKQAAADLGVSQALLSHYEKGIRECGLEFLVNTADYYNVSCDYLLGRCAEPMGKADNAPHNDAAESGTDKLTAPQKMLINSEKLIFSFLNALEDAALEKSVRGYLSLAVYRIFRVIYSANPKNDRRFFTVDSPGADGFTSAAMELKKAQAENAAKNGAMQNVQITTNSISEDHPEYASALLNQIKSCEDCVNTAMNSAEE